MAAPRSPAAGIREAYAGRASQQWRIAETLYSREELAGLPPDLALSALGLGNPVRDARLEPGELVLDVGCGSGIDTLLAARAVSPGGRVMGLDITEELLAIARHHAAQSGAGNVDFLLAPMEEIPLADASVDVVISNGVINLSEDKDSAFLEAWRVLRPGGRMVAADMLLVSDLPSSVLAHPKLWSG
jgi:arsenite methyltransferase